jgi:hypothetical protein
MAIIKILGASVILLVCSLIQVFVIITECASALLAKISNYLDKLSNKLMRMVNKKHGKQVIDVPL